MNKQELIEELECLEVPTDSYSYLRGANYAVEKAISLAERLDEPKKVVVPKFVAEWIEYAKKKGDSLSASFKPWDLYGAEYGKVNSWIKDNEETYAHAWLDGYEVEKGPLYHVLLPDKGATNTGYTFLNLAGAIDFTTCKEKVDMLTEQEIKAVDERYWPFAVKVDGE
ncbi:DUF1642 domain-containing protein [Enterococcus sp. IsoGale005]|uniref:DUF1642 domain-containing protein n=1 Tax=Enterococcus sp. IsoGale005 TaxID=2923522 RepID=UPI00280FD01D|nr:DUF1642 domain-containing protein [Enterococcus sp. IsoGale005]MDQ8688410.1 DUF1642 domain-containing protein [Enterococcus sp. IsoGale005]